MHRSKAYKVSTKATIAGWIINRHFGKCSYGRWNSWCSCYTFGGTLGFTAAGAVLTGAGGVTVAGSKVYDHVQTKKGNAEVKEWIKGIELLCKEAQSSMRSYNMQLCEKL